MNRHNNYHNGAPYTRFVGQEPFAFGPAGTRSLRGNVLYWLSYVVFFAMAALGFAAFIWFVVMNGKYIQTISGVGPTAGEVTQVAGQGISILTNPVASSITISNDGVLKISGVPPTAGGDLALTAGTGVVITPNIAGNEITIAVVAGKYIETLNGVGPTAGGEVTLVAGTAIGVVPNAGAHTITLNNEGVTDLTAGDGIFLSATTGSIDVAHLLTKNTLLPFGDPNGPQVSYITSMGFFVPENTWRTGFFPGFFPLFFPGVTPGDGGVGNGFITWTVPSPGEYQISAGCAVFPSAIRANDTQIFHLAINLGASTADPSMSGYIPYGASMSMDISNGGTASPTTFRRFSVSGIVHAGCTGCPVMVGDALSIHLMQDHTGVGAPVTFSAVCRIQVAKTE